MVGYLLVVLFSLCVVVLPALSYFIKWSPTVLNVEKLTAFECGFEPLSSSRMSFSLRFFILVVIFLIFDIEVALLLPILTKILNNSLNFSLAMNLMFFLVVLMVGLMYEWKEGSLDWVENS